MGQSLRHLLNILFFSLLIGCDPSPTASPTTQPTKIVSLTPAGTNLMMAMGITDKLVGVSAYDKDPAVQNLPKVGDYQRIDWEQLASIKPSHLIVQGKKDRLPPGVEEHSKALGIQVSILQIDRLDDIYAAIDQIGKAVGEEAKSQQAITSLKKKLITVSSKPVPAIVMIGGEGKLIVGRDNYINDLLELASGTNVIETNGYISIDAEKAATLKPEVIFILASAGATADAKSLVVSSPHWPALEKNRIFILADDQSLLPGACITKVYDFFRQKLSDSTGATTQP